MGTELVVLLVEDEPLVARVLSRGLASLGCSVRAAPDLDGARALLETEIHVAISDLNLGQRAPDGAAVLAMVQERWPRALRVLVSGSDDGRVDAARASGIAQICRSKPIQLATLEEILAVARRGEPPREP